MTSAISPYISEGSGLKRFNSGKVVLTKYISPYISEGSGLKQKLLIIRAAATDISPYISEGSGLKQGCDFTGGYKALSPLTSVRGAD